MLTANSATTAIASDDDWGSEVLRVAPQRELPTVIDFLWMLADAIGGRARYIGDISKLLGIKTSKEKVSRSGSLYATLKALIRQGYAVYEQPTECQGKYRLTAEGLRVCEWSTSRIHSPGFWDLEDHREKLEEEAERLERRLTKVRSELDELERRQAAL